MLDTDCCSSSSTKLVRRVSFCVRFMQAVLSAHDTVAQKNFDPVLPPLPEELDDGLEEESVKIVRLVKNKEPLVRATSVMSPQLLMLSS